MRLLILSCSATKRTIDGLLPALTRYDGPAYRVLRNALRDLPQERHPRIAILSARFGLIAGDTPLPWYDCQMTPERAAVLTPAVQRDLRTWLQPDITDIFITLGRAYRPVLGDIPLGAWRITEAQGGIGVRLGQLRRWLREGGA
jgi:hypothetical protein